MGRRRTLIQERERRDADERANSEQLQASALTSLHGVAMLLRTYTCVGMRMQPSDDAAGQPFLLEPSVRHRTRSFANRSPVIFTAPPPVCNMGVCGSKKATALAAQPQAASTLLAPGDAEASKRANELAPEAQAAPAEPETKGEQGESLLGSLGHAMQHALETVAETAEHVAHDAKEAFGKAEDKAEEVAEKVHEKFEGVKAEDKASDKKDAEVDVIEDAIAAPQQCGCWGA